MILSREQHAGAIERAVFPALQGGPHNHTTAAIGVALHEAATEEFRAYGHQVVRNAKALAGELLERGFTLISGGTDNHLILVDLTNKGVFGKKAAKALDRAGIVCNYNTIPNDPRKPFSPSGIRIGTPAVTSRGMGEAEMRQIAAWMDQVVAAPNDEALSERVRGEVRDLCRAFPVPGIPIGG
jgi:glycine hydroxymethyltransferase